MCEREREREIKREKKRERKRRREVCGLEKSTSANTKRKTVGGR